LITPQTATHNVGFTGATSSFHWEGTYTVTVTADSSMNCHFEADLTGPTVTQ